MIDKEEYLISYANLKSNLFKHQKNFINDKMLKTFYENPFFGMPQCLPINIKYFNYSKSKFFKINQLEFSKNIFQTNNLEYIGNKKFFRYGNIFATNATLKKEYKRKFQFYLNNILNSKKKIKSLNKIYKNVCSMQIRNVPHFGHEAVFKYLLSKFDFLILNPIFGLKKKNDFKDIFISKSLKFIEKKYKKIKFIPIYSNFYYGGPREALHHLSIREKLGFNFFYIGRDHAGAENMYSPFQAINKSLKYSKKFKIKQVTAKGGCFCETCKNYVIKGICRHKAYTDISGTEFRKYLFSNEFYHHADKNMQKLLLNKKK